MSFTQRNQGSFGKIAEKTIGTFNAQNMTGVKIRSSTLGILLGLALFSAKGQGTLVFDQQSSTDERPLVGGIQLPGQPGYGDAQSFIPSLSSVGFIRLMLNGSGGGATVYVDLRSSSIYGPILGTSSPVTMVSSGPKTAVWNVVVGQYPYNSGTAYLNGNPLGNQNFWFREGIIVPEPSSAALLVVVGGGVWAICRRMR